MGFLSLALAGSILVTAAGMWALMAWVHSGAAEANGVSSEIYNQVQGPYRLVVGISPGRPVIPQTHFAMQVMDADQDTLLRDSDIQLFVTATGPDGSVGFGPEQTYNDLSLAYFEIDVPFDVVGPWRVSVEINADESKEVFVLPVSVGEPGPRIQWIWVSVVLVAIVAVGIWTSATMSRRGSEGSA